MNKYYFWDNLRTFFRVNKALVITICCIICLGILTGIFCVAKTSTEVLIIHIQCLPLRFFLLHKMSLIGFLLLESLFVAICFALIFFMSYTRWCKVLVVVLSLYLSFRLGITIAVLVCIFGVAKGLLYGVVAVFVPCGFRLVMYQIFGFRMCHFNTQLCVFGNSSIRGEELKLALWFGGIGICSVAVQTIILLILNNLFVF